MRKRIKLWLALTGSTQTRVRVIRDSASWKDEVLLGPSDVLIGHLALIVTGESGAETIAKQWNIYCPISYSPAHIPLDSVPPT